MGKGIVNQVKEVWRLPCRINPRRDTPKYILVKLTKTKHKEKNIKSSKGKSTKDLQLERSSVQLLSCVQLFATPWTTARQASLSITNSWGSPKLISNELVMPSNHLILCHPLLFPPLIFPSIRVFSNESVLHIRWPKYWSFSFNLSPSSEYSGLISFRMDWLDLLAVQGTLLQYQVLEVGILLQYHSSKASILWLSAFFIGQLSHPYMTTGKTGLD